MGTLELNFAGVVETVTSIAGVLMGLRTHLVSVLGGGAYRNMRRYVLKETNNDYWGRAGKINLQSQRIRRY